MLFKYIDAMTCSVLFFFLCTTLLHVRLSVNRSLPPEHHKTRHLPLYNIPHIYVKKPTLITVFPFKKFAFLQSMELIFQAKSCFFKFHWNKQFSKLL